MALSPGKLLLSSCFLLLSTQSSIATTVPLLRSYTPIGTDHFYTTNTTEMSQAISSPSGYIFEGNAALVLSSPSLGDPAAVPFFRTYNPSQIDHFYTTDAGERDRAVSLSGYVDEGIVAYVYPPTYQAPHTVPFFRMYNPVMTDHFYTTDAQERDDAAATGGYIYEGIAAYVDPA